MKKISRILLKLSFVFSVLVPFFYIGVEKANSYRCPSGYYCSQYGGITDGVWNKKRGYCSSAYTTYNCSGTDSACNGGYDTYASYSDCINNVVYGFAGCCNYGSPPCNDCNPPACPAGTTTTNTGYYHSQTSCDRGSGCNPRYNTRNCYCLTCTPPNCGPTYSDTNIGFGSLNLSCFNGCAYQYRTCYCNQCTPPNCPSDLSNSNLGFGVSTVTTNCTNACGVGNTRSCFCRDCNLNVPNGTTLTNTGRQSTDPSLQTTSCSRGQGCALKTGSLYCTRCNPPACGPTYQTSNQGYGSITFSCNNAIRSCGIESRTCYCNECTPPACGPTYAETNYGYGSVRLSCTNDCSVTSSRTCYVDRCSNCTPPSCPSPLSATSPGDPNMILSNFTSCTRTTPCGGPPNYRSCYEPISPQPTTSLQIHPDGENIYGFSSSTHSGNRTPLYNLNDPIRMTATYTDVNGATDIEAVSVWFRENTITGEVATPLWIDTAANPSQPPQAPAANSWGFMMRWESSAWRPYVPSYAGGTAKWVRAVFSNNSFVISGPGGLQMVRVTIGHNLQANITRSGNNVVMPFQLSFNFASGYENVAQVTYNTFLMGNDIFSFTPYDNYTAYPEINSKIGDYWSPGQLRYRTTPTVAQLYARQWSTTGYSWTIDKGDPEVGTLNMTVIGDTNLRLSWAVADTKEIYAIVGNIYASITMPPNPPAITITGTGLEINSPFNLITDDTHLGKLNTGYAFRKLNIGGTTYSGSVDIDIGENKEGSLIVYLTVFDKAGNMHIRSFTFSLGDWIITHGGFAYSSNGRDYEMKAIASPEAWNAVPVLAGMSPSHADVSTELFGDNVGGTNPSALNTSVLLKSFHMRPFSMNTNIKSLYEELRKAYNDREIEGKVDMTKALPQVTSLNGSLRSIGGCNLSSKVCILKHSGDFQVGNISNFVCDGWGVFFVDGDLTIHKEIRTANSNKDACIFVVSGNVNIKEGEKASTPGQLQYDQVRAYILADGHITIDPELGLSPKYDGLFVEGGLHSLGGLQMNRSLKLVDRNIYPALVVKYHSKYSVLSNLVFGSQVDILKTELGFKPY